MFRYRIFDPEGNERGEATYAQPIHPGEVIHALDGSRLRVLGVVPIEEEASPFVGLLQVAPQS